MSRQQVRRFLTDNDEVSKLRERQGLVDLEGFDLQYETSLQGVFGVQQDQLDQLCDGEPDSTGRLWPLHVRDRLPLDLLSCLPGAVKAVGDKRGAAVPGTAAGAAGAAAGGADVIGAEDTEFTADSELGGVQDAVAVMHQFRPQIQARACREGCWLLQTLAGAAPMRGLQQVDLGGVSRERSVCYTGRQVLR
jgi:hypothetical protein